MGAGGSPDAQDLSLNNPSFCPPPSPPGTTPGPEPKVAELPGAQPRPGCSQRSWARRNRTAMGAGKVLGAGTADLKSAVERGFVAGMGPLLYR